GPRPWIADDGIWASSREGLLRVAAGVSGEVLAKVPVEGLADRDSEVADVVAAPGGVVLLASARMTMLSSPARLAQRLAAPTRDADASAARACRRAERSRSVADLAAANRLVGTAPARAALEVLLEDAARAVLRAGGPGAERLPAILEATSALALERR